MVDTAPNSPGLGEQRRFTVDPGQLAHTRARSANSTARKAIEKAELCKGIKVNVVDTIIKGTEYYTSVLEKIKTLMDGEPFLFVIFRAPPYKDKSSWPVAMAASSPFLLARAAILLHAKFQGRLRIDDGSGDPPWLWQAEITASDHSQRDSDLLQEVVRKAPTSRTSVELITAACTRLSRISAEDAHKTLVGQSEPTSPKVYFVDIRTAAQRTEHGTIPLEGVLHVERVILESFFDSTLESQAHVAYDPDDPRSIRVILFDQDGTASALAACALHEIGITNATDMIGGYVAWKEAAFPVTHDLMTFPD